MRQEEGEGREWWSAGVLECWSAGVLECWSAGVLECWFEEMAWKVNRPLRYFLRQFFAERTRRRNQGWGRTAFW